MTEELFVKKLPVIVKLQEHEDRRVHIQIAVELHQLTNPLTRKEIVVRLTDEKDFYFLYNLRLSEEDFQSLKLQLGLLVDFAVFPHQFIGLLDQCLQEEHKEVPKFVLHLVCNGSTLASTANLNVIETNQFRHLTHLSLKFLPGTDAEVKRYLSDSLKTVREQQIALLQRLELTESDLTTQLRQTREALANRTQELSNIKPEYTAKINELINRHSLELNSERDKVIQTQAGLQQKSEQTRKELEQNHQRTVAQLEVRLRDLDSSTKELTDFKYKAESSLREYKCRLGVAEDENSRLKQDLERVRSDHASSGSDRHEQERLIAQLRMKLAVFEQEIKDKEDMMRRTTDLLGAEQDFKKKTEEEVDRKKRHINKLESSLKTVSTELVKANEIIQKLQGEIKTYHTKLKLRTQITGEQEKLLVEKQREMEELRRELEGTRTSLSQRGEENKKLNDSLEATLQKLDESRQLLKTNENVINWLNKQVTESQLTNQRTGMFEMPHSSYGPSPVGTLRPANSTQQSFGSTYPSYRPQSTDPSPLTTTGQIRQTLVQYQAPAGRSSMVPVPVSKSTPISGSGGGGGGAEPAGGRQTDLHSSPVLAKGKDTEREGFLDPKYLQQSIELPTRPALKDFNTRVSPLTANIPSAPTFQRATKDVHAPQTAPPPPGGGPGQQHNPIRNNQPPNDRTRQTAPLNHPPLASAYFPSKAF